MMLLNNRNLELTPRSYVQVFAGAYISGALKSDGTCWTWGYGVTGALGNNTLTLVSSPISVAGNHSFIKVVAGEEFCVGLKSDGTAWAWGYGANGRLGALIDNTNRSSPTAVGGNHSFIDITCGNAYTIALKSDGTAWAWGYNTSGELGVGDSTIRSSPTSVAGGHSFIKVFSRAYTTVALKADGTAWCWGGNGSSGTLGQGFAAINRSSPVSVIGGHSFVDISVGVVSTYAIKADGSGWAWGGNGDNALGDGTNTNRSSPVSVIGGHSFTKILGAPTGYKAFALRGDGVLFTWGRDNLDGVIGSTGNIYYGTPLGIASGISDFQPSNGGLFTVVNGVISHWGRGIHGISGDGTSNMATSPKQVAGGYSFVKVSSGFAHSMALKSDGSAWCWGTNGYNNMGIAVSVSNRAYNYPVPTVGGHSFANAVVGYYFSLALKSDGSVWGWGYNSQGQLGDESVSSRSYPITVHGGHSFTQITAGLAASGGLKADGSAWMWGINSNGQLGQGSDTNSRSSPVSVIGNHSFIQLITSGYYDSSTNSRQTIALKADGSCWAWGGGSYGQLGQGTTTNGFSSPVSVVGNHSFIKIASNCGPHNVALKADGTVWCWGRGDSGQCGDYTNTNRSSPVSVVGGHSFIDISASPNCSFALKSNGTLWAWGLGDRSQAGVGSLTSKSSPTMVVGGNTFSSMGGGGLYFSSALKSDGSVWTWGTGALGELGDAQHLAISSPKLVLGGSIFRYS